MGIKHAVNEHFFEEWSAEMAYVLGYIYADGSLVHDPVSRGKYLGITSTDPDILSIIKNVIESKHIIRADKITGNRKPKFTLRIGNAYLFNSLIKRGLYQNKSLTIPFPEISPEYIFDFIRGYFDGDGCVYIGKAVGKTQPIILKRLLVVFTSGSFRFIEGLSQRLKEHLGATGRIYQSQRAFQLRLFTHDSMELFSKMYADPSISLFLPRKRAIFLRYFSLKKRRIDTSVKSVLESLR